MLNLTESGDPAAGCPEKGYLRTPELIMEWIDICADSAAHTGAGGLTIGANAHAHRDQFVAVWVAVWIEEGAIPPPTAC